jgi:hypothetical protein
MLDLERCGQTEIVTQPVIIAKALSLAMIMEYQYKPCVPLRLTYIYPHLIIFTVVQTPFSFLHLTRGPP